MTDKLRQAAERALEALQEYTDVVATAHDADNWHQVIDGGKPAREAIQALRQALDQLPDTTIMIEPSISIVGWMYEDQLPEIYPYEEMFPFSVVDGVRMFPVYAPKAEPEMGIDRGAWSDVPDATKWVDELRGDEDLEEPPKREWQGLTEDERRAIMRQFGVWTFSNEWLACLEVEAKLKEKNSAP